MCVALAISLRVVVFGRAHGFLFLSLTESSLRSRLCGQAFVKRHQENKDKAVRSKCTAPLKIFTELKIGKKYVFNHRINKRSSFASDFMCMFPFPVPSEIKNK